jgi:hypothetical protein
VKATWGPLAADPGTVDVVKRDGARPPVIALVAALFCVVVAIGAGLQGQFVFTGPRWTPGIGKQPVLLYTPPPSPQPSSTGPPKNPHVGSGVVFSWLPILIVFGVIVVAAVALLVWYWLRNHPRGGTQDPRTLEDLVGTVEIGTEPDLPTLQRGLVRAADALETTREPRDAIVRAWIGLQEAAEDSGVRRRDSETPTEFTSRVFAAVDADREAAASLLEVYLRVRFGSKPASEPDVAAAREAIERLRATWPVSADS